MSSSTYTRRLGLLLVLAAIVLAVKSQQFSDDKREAGPNQRPFYMGSRYGRSDHTNKVVVAPRTDRFFMGSRYGKRSFQSGPVVGPATLICSANGFDKIYRCVPDNSNWKPDSPQQTLEEPANDASATGDLI